MRSTSASWTRSAGRFPDDARPHGAHVDHRGRSGAQRAHGPPGAVGQLLGQRRGGAASELLKEHVLHDFDELWPEKFNNKTNGVTPRRFMRLANPRLASLITRDIGDGWLAGPGGAAPGWSLMPTIPASGCAGAR